MPNAASTIQTDPWPTLPLLQQAVNSLNLQSASPFASSHAILCQHLLPSIVPLFNVLFELGLEPNRVWVIGKSYSTSPDVVRWLQEQGCLVKVASVAPPGKYDLSLKLAASQVWDEIHSRRSCQTIIGVDHGGFLRSTIRHDLTSRLVFVEHTSRGTHKSGSNKYICVDMARSTPKRELENLVIARQIVSALDDRGVLQASWRIGVLGLGPVGQAVTRELTARGCTVAATDPRFSPHAIAALGARPFATAHDLTRGSDLILGCTGTDISLHLASQRDEVHVASCSSSDIEFSALLYRNRANLKATGRDYILETRRQKITILDRGFPINFSWALRHTDQAIGLTRSLTLFAMIQAARLVRDDLYVPLDSTLSDLAHRLVTQTTASTSSKPNPHPHHR
jgi:S-adenosylhomocysteine hydrolase